MPEMLQSSCWMRTMEAAAASAVNRRQIRVVFITTSVGLWIVFLYCLYAGEHNFWFL